MIRLNHRASSCGWFTGAATLFLLTLAQLSAAERVPWTTSRVQGSPEPPPPYRVTRAFPQLTFSAPLDAVTIPGTNRIVIVEQRGKLFSIPNDESVEKPELFADAKQFDQEVVESYGIAFHPRFAENRYAFVWLNFDLKGKPNREDATRIIRLRVTEENPPRLDFDSAQTIFTWLSGGHNGGNIRFGPDGMLYISTGDAESPDPPDRRVTGQDISDVLASVLRIDVDNPDSGKSYGIPPDNPFVNTPGARGEVWAYGFRNPWRLSFDPKTGDLWVGDVGWELWEMIYRVERGGNYGWSITEGGQQDVRPDRPRGPTPILPPAAAHSHEEAASITGGDVYYGDALPELRGAFIYGDWQTGTFWSLRKGGEPQELCRSTLMPAGFGIAPDGELLICDHTGGGLWRLEPNPEAGRQSKFPRLLSETGLFSDVAKQAPAPGVASYAVRAPRWADHAKGERWIGLPGESTISIAQKELGVMPRGRWVFPKDSVLAKTYSLEMEHGNSASRRRVETQMLHFDGLQWAAYTYRWNDAQTDAELLPGRGGESTFEVKDASAPGGVRLQTWRHFSRAECLRCHNLWNNFAPGFSEPQLDRGEAELLALLGVPEGTPKLVNPHHETHDLELRARSYLDANCSACHRMGGGGSVPSVMNIEAKLEEAKLVNSAPVQGDLGLPEARVIAPADPARSVLLYRMTTSGRGHMPYLGSRLIDNRGVALVRDWIVSIKPAGDLPRDVQAQRDAEQEALAKLLKGDAEPLPKLLETASGALSIALAVTDGALTGRLREEVIAKGAAIPDPLRRDLFERFLPPAQRRQVLGAEFDRAALLALKGDIGRGKAVFEALCAACHRAGEQGRDFGPDLTQIARKFERAAMLEQIVDPAKVIDPQWHLTTVTLKGGETVSGFIAERSDSSLSVKQADGTSRSIPTGDIENTTTARISLMPEGLLQSVTSQEAADLLSFLANQR